MSTKEKIALLFLVLLFAACVGQLVSAFIKQAERDAQPQRYIITIEYKPVGVADFGGLQG